MKQNQLQPLNIIIPISLGELVDKISILEIKYEKINSIKVNNIEKELSLLKNIFNELSIDIDNALLISLRDVNKLIWEFEDDLRLKEMNLEFDDHFINLARSVYKMNDKRSKIKREINYRYNSSIIEEKSYSNY
tara:strand:+ start:414 stop:815 length:402 start_codon:yes stop_codon:yes gene_type:complete